DTAGNRIHAHGGSLIHVDGTFYWYRENKEHSIPGSDIWHGGVRCSSSADLYNWTDEGLIIPPEPDDLTSPLHPSQGMDRPHIIRNPDTGTFVCWVKVIRPRAEVQRLRRRANPRPVPAGSTGPQAARHACRRLRSCSGSHRRQGLL